jgi:hypothetical protein
MSDDDIARIELSIGDALDGDHCEAVDVLCRGLIRTLGELKRERAANDDLRTRPRILRIAQSA